MTKKLALQFINLLLFVLTCNYGFSQSKNVSFGVKAGIGIPDLKASGDNPVSSGWSSRLGPYAGFVAALKLNKRFSFRAELNYASQGGKKNGIQAIPTSGFEEYFPAGSIIPAYVYADYKSEAKLNYIELPVLAQIDFRLSNMVSFFIDTGPYAGYLIKANNVTSGSSNIYFDENLTQPFLPSDISFDQTADIKSDLKKFNLGIQGGIGITLNISNKSSIMLTGGGNYGLIKIQKDNSNGENNTGAATVTLGYLIKL